MSVPVEYGKIIISEACIPENVQKTPLLRRTDIESGASRPICSDEVSFLSRTAAPCAGVLSLLFIIAGATLELPDIQRRNILIAGAVLGGLSLCICITSYIAHRRLIPTQR